MSDLELIIPVAILLVVALGMGSSGGGSSKTEAEQEEELFEEYYKGRFQEDFGVRDDTKTVRSDMTSRTEQRFDTDRQVWQKDPREGKTLIRSSEDITAEVLKSVDRIEELAKTLDGIQDRDADSEALAQELQVLITAHQTFYSDFKERHILKYYIQELTDMEDYISRSIAENNESFTFGGSQPMSMQDRKVTIQKITELISEMSDFTDRQANVIYQAKESLKMHELMDEPGDKSFLNAKAPESELGGYAISETNSEFKRTVPAAERSAFTQLPTSRLSRPAPMSAPVIYPGVICPTCRSRQPGR